MKQDTALPILSIVVPAYNEEATIGIILDKLCSIACVRQVIVVDDCSTDATVARVRALNNSKIILLHQESNQGKTAAVRCGLEHVTGEITIFQDADLEYNPNEIPDVITPIVENKADVVYGSRFLVKRATRVLYFYHYLANQLLTFCSNLLTNVNMTDIETCYKAFRTPLIQDLPLTSSGFGMEVEITALISKTRARIYEVPISYYGRTYEEGKKIHFSDALAALWYIVYFNFIAPHTAVTRNYISGANAFVAQFAAPQVLNTRDTADTKSFAPGEEMSLRGVK